MSRVIDTARAFFDACETGKGWEGCREHCHPDATFSCQAEALADVETMEGYTEWMAGLIAIMPDGRYDLRFFALDEERSAVGAYAVFHGTHTEEGGPALPTGKKTKSDYVYIMDFDGDRIRHMTKIWNAPYAMKELGWA